jgi:SP family xylose:H+ symportor-like MFS transporter
MSSDRKSDDTNYRLGLLNKLTITATLASFICGYQIGVINTCLENVAETLGWGDRKLTMISVNSAIMPIGAIFGAFAAGKLANSLGRRKALLVTNIISIIGCGLNVVPFDATFSIGRFIGGIVAGLGSSIPPVYGDLYIVNEIAPPEISGKLGSITQFQITFGILVSFAMGIPLPVDNRDDDPMNNWWIVMFLFPALISILQIILLVCVYPYDTPKWNMENGKRMDAEDLLRKIYKGDTWQPEYKELENIQPSAQSNPGSRSRETLLKKDASYKDLILGAYKKATFVGCSNIYIALSMLQQLTGINTFIFYSSKIFMETGGDAKQAVYFTTAMGFFNMTATLLSLVFVDSKKYVEFGRKFMLMQGAMGMAICQGLLGLFVMLEWTPYLQLVVMLIFVAFFESSLGPVLWIYSTEILNDKGVSLVVATNWIFCSIIGAVFPVMSSDSGIGIANSFFLFAGCCLFAFLYVMFFVIETKGLTSEEIQDKFMKRNG